LERSRSKVEERLAVPGGDKVAKIMLARDCGIDFDNKWDDVDPGDEAK
jgi:hypothetical protein